MRRLVPFLGFFLMASYAIAAEPPPEVLRVSDGSLLFVDKSGYMTMVDSWGRPMKMKDGVPMRMEDDSIIPMKNHPLERRRNRGSLNPKF